MDAGFQSRVFAHVVCLCMGALCSTAALAQGYGYTASFAPRFSNTIPRPYTLNIPAVRVGDRFYEVVLDYRAPSFVLASAAEVFIDGDYASGSYSNNVLDLQCVFHQDLGTYYSARLVSAAPDNYSFTLQAATKLEACPLPAGVSPARGQWVRTAQSPLSARDGSSFAWVGGEILVLGGTSFACSPYANVDCAAPASNPLLYDGAAYNPATNTWRKIADAPASVVGRPVTVGTNVVALAQPDHRSSYRLLRYRSTEDRWDAFDLPPNVTGPWLAAFGTTVVVYAYEDRTGAVPDWSFDPVTGQWTQLPDDPLGAGYSRSYLAFGADLYLFDLPLPRAFGGPEGPGYLRAARLRGQQWSRLPASGSVNSGPTLIAGNLLVAPWLGCNEDNAPDGRCLPFGAVFDTTTDTWRDLPKAPGRGLHFFYGSGGLGENGLSLLSLGYPMLDATNNEWFIAPKLDSSADIRHNIGVAGPYGFALGGVTVPAKLLSDSWIWKP